MYTCIYIYIYIYISRSRDRLSPHAALNIIVNPVGEGGKKTLQKNQNHVMLPGGVGGGRKSCCPFGSKSRSLSLSFPDVLGKRTIALPIAACNVTDVATIQPEWFLVPECPREGT